jgi:hypothetical protein
LRLRKRSRAHLNASPEGARDGIHVHGPDLTDFLFWNNGRAAGANRHGGPRDVAGMATQRPFSRVVFFATPFCGTRVWMSGRSLRRPRLLNCTLAHNLTIRFALSEMK